MNWRGSLSDEDRNSILMDAHEAFNTTHISETEYRTILIKCGLNATDIEDEVRRNAPKP